MVKFAGDALLIIWTPSTLDPPEEQVVAFAEAYRAARLAQKRRRADASSVGSDVTASPYLGVDAMRVSHAGALSDEGQHVVSGPPSRTQHPAQGKVMPEAPLLSETGQAGAAPESEEESKGRRAPPAVTGPASVATPPAIATAGADDPRLRLLRIQALRARISPSHAHGSGGDGSGGDGSSSGGPWDGAVQLPDLGSPMTDESPVPDRPSTLPPIDTGGLTPTPERKSRKGRRAVEGDVPPRVLRKGRLRRRAERRRRREKRLLSKSRALRGHTEAEEKGGGDGPGKADQEDGKEEAAEANGKAGGTLLPAHEPAGGSTINADGHGAQPHAPVPVGGSWTQGEADWVSAHLGSDQALSVGSPDQPGVGASRDSLPHAGTGASATRRSLSLVSRSRQTLDKAMASPTSGSAARGGGGDGPWVAAVTTGAAPQPHGEFQAPGSALSTILSSTEPRRGVLTRSGSDRVESSKVHLGRGKLGGTDMGAQRQRPYGGLSPPTGTRRRGRSLTPHREDRHHPAAAPAVAQASPYASHSLSLSPNPAQARVRAGVGAAAAPRGTESQGGRAEGEESVAETLMRLQAGKRLSTQDQGRGDSDSLSEDSEDSVDAAVTAGGGDGGGGGGGASVDDAASFISQRTAATLPQEGSLTASAVSGGGAPGVGDFRRSMQQFRRDHARRASVANRAAVAAGVSAATAAATAANATGTLAVVSESGVAGGAGATLHSASGVLGAENDPSAPFAPDFGSEGAAVELGLAGQPRDLRLDEMNEGSSTTDNSGEPTPRVDGDTPSALIGRARTRGDSQQSDSRMSPTTGGSTPYSGPPQPAPSANDGRGGQDLDAGRDAYTEGAAADREPSPEDEQPGRTSLLRRLLGRGRGSPWGPLVQRSASARAKVTESPTTGSRGTSTGRSTPSGQSLGSRFRSVHQRLREDDQNIYVSPAADSHEDEESPSSWPQHGGGEDDRTQDDRLQTPAAAGGGRESAGPQQRRPSQLRFEERDDEGTADAHPDARASRPGGLFSMFSRFCARSLPTRKRSRPSWLRRKRRARQQAPAPAPAPGSEADVDSDAPEQWQGTPRQSHAARRTANSRRRGPRRSEDGERPPAKRPARPVRRETQRGMLAAGRRKINQRYNWGQDASGATPVGGTPVGNRLKAAGLLAPNTRHHFRQPSRRKSKASPATVATTPAVHEGGSIIGSVLARNTSPHASGTRQSPTTPQSIGRRDSNYSADTYRLVDAADLPTSGPESDAHSPQHLQLPVVGNGRSRAGSNVSASSAMSATTAHTADEEESRHVHFRVQEGGNRVQMWVDRQHRSGSPNRGQEREGPGSPHRRATSGASSPTSEGRSATPAATSATGAASTGAGSMSDGVRAILQLMKSRSRRALLAFQATACAMALQRELDGFEGLTLHIGVGTGHAHLLNLGGLLDRWEFVLAGESLEQMAAAEGGAHSKEVCVSQETWRALSPLCDGEAQSGVVRVDRIRPECSPLTMRFGADGGSVRGLQLDHSQSRPRTRRRGATKSEAMEPTESAASLPMSVGGKPRTSALAPPSDESETPSVRSAYTMAPFSAQAGQSRPHLPRLRPVQEPTTTRAADLWLTWNDQVRVTLRSRPDLLRTLEAYLLSYVPGGIREHIRGGGGALTAEHRRCSVLFVNLPGLDYSVVGAGSGEGSVRSDKFGGAKTGRESVDTGAGSTGATSRPGPSRAASPATEGGTQGGRRSSDALAMLLTVMQRVMVTMQTTLYSYEGQLRQYIVDDKGTTLIAVFGLYPFSHENDPLLAARCALDMASALRAIDVPCQIGVTTGMVFAGAVGSSRRCEHAVIGDSVNLSARLMVAAKKVESGPSMVQVLCDRDTYREAGKGGVRFRKEGRIKVKGKEAYIPIFRPLRFDTNAAVRARSAVSGRRKSQERGGEGEGAEASTPTGGLTPIDSMPTSAGAVGGSSDESSEEEIDVPLIGHQPEISAMRRYVQRLARMHSEAGAGREKSTSEGLVARVLGDHQPGAAHRTLTELRRGQGCVVAMEAEPGHGKSTVLRHIGDSVVEEEGVAGHVFPLLSKCDAIESSSPFAAFRPPVLRLLRAHNVEDWEASLPVLRLRVRGLVGSGRPDRVDAAMALLSEIVPGYLVCPAVSSHPLLALPRPRLLRRLHELLFGLIIQYSRSPRLPLLLMVRCPAALPSPLPPLSPSHCSWTTRTTWTRTPSASAWPSRT